MLESRTRTVVWTGRDQLATELLVHTIVWTGRDQLATELLVHTRAIESEVEDTRIRAVRAVQAPWVEVTSVARNWVPDRESSAVARSWPPRVEGPIQNTGVYQHRCHHCNGPSGTIILKQLLVYVHRTQSHTCTTLSSSIELRESENVMLLLRERCDQLTCQQKQQQDNPTHHDR